MKSVLICTSYWPQTFVAHHALSLKTWRPLVLSVVGNDQADANELQITSVSRRSFSLSNALFTSFGSSNVATQLIRDFDPKLIHVHFLTVAAAMLPFLRRTGRPFVVSSHGYDVTSEKFANPFLQWMMRTRLQGVFSEVERVLCVSDYIRDCVIERGCPREKAITHYLGIPIPPLETVDRDPSRVVFVGRLVPKKGILTLLRAASMLRARGLNVSVHVVGDGPQREEGEKLANEIGVDATWLGAQQRSRVLREMAEASVFCMPSTRAPDGDNEGFGLVYLEAQALETPVAAFAQGPVTEAVRDNETGLLAPDQDVEGLADRIATLLGNPALAARMGRAGRVRVLREFDISAQTRKLESIYDALT